MAFGQQASQSEEVQQEFTKEQGFTERVFYPADNKKKKTEIEFIFLKTTFGNEDAQAVHTVPNKNGYTKVKCDRGLRSLIAKEASERHAVGDLVWYYDKGTKDKPKTCKLCTAFEATKDKDVETLGRRGVEALMVVKVLSLTEVNKETKEEVVTEFDNLIGVVGMSVLDAYFPSLKGLGNMLATYEADIDKKDKVNKLTNHTFKYSTGKLIHNDKLDKATIEELKQYRDNPNLLEEMFPHLMPASYQQWLNDTGGKVEGIMSSVGKPVEPEVLTPEDDKMFDVDVDLSKPII